MFSNQRKNWMTTVKCYRLTWHISSVAVKGQWWNDCSEPFSMSKAVHLISRSTGHWSCFISSTQKQTALTLFNSSDWTTVFWLLVMILDLMLAVTHMKWINFICSYCSLVNSFSSFELSVRDSFHMHSFITFSAILTPLSHANNFPHFGPHYQIKLTWLLNHRFTGTFTTLTACLSIYLFIGNLLESLLL